jgi:two-component system nitrate/nitrite sensor histidine kinase NarX
MARTQWSLGAKLALLGAPFLLLVLLSTAATLWVSWQLDGGAAAVNEAGRMRMQAYRMALSIGLRQSPETLREEIDEFDRSLALLRAGDPERPLFVPWDDAVRARFAAVADNWARTRAHWLAAPARPALPPPGDELPAQVGGFVADIDALVIAIESHMARWTTVLYLLQISVLAVSLLVAAILVYTGYVFVLEPVGQLKQAIERIRGGDFAARVEHLSSDEFGTLALGFNDMADMLQSMYRNLEHRVSEKTHELEEKRERLEGLYEVTALLAQATTLDELARGFAASVRRIARADAIAVRWSDEQNKRYLMLAAQGMPQALLDAEQCIDAGRCHCGMGSARGAGDGRSETGHSGQSSLGGARCVPIAVVPAGSGDGPANDTPLLPCARAGFRTVINVPVRLHERLIGEVDLFFNASVEPPPALRSLLDALCAHLASAMENLRVNALEKEAAVAQERVYLARELHDSIAQSLAFIKIQVQLMRRAVDTGELADVRTILEEIDVGVRESYGDVRELLLHFRTRANAEDIEPALATTLRKFEHQSGVAATLEMHGQGVPLSPDRQIQVLHIIQEALSNVRKHASASHVHLSVQQQPVWRFTLTDDGVGFAVDDDTLDETHVGLRIMKERADRLGAELEIASRAGHGSTIVLTLPTSAAGQEHGADA